MTSPATNAPAGPDQLVRRLAALTRLEQAGQLRVAALDRITRLATRVTGAPVGLIVLVGDDQESLVSHVGLPRAEASSGQAQMSRELCRTVAVDGRPLVVSDTRNEDWRRSNVAVREPGVVAYAGMPLVAAGECVGSMCLVDEAPRDWSARDLAALSDLAACAADELALHLALAEQAATSGELRSTGEVLELVTKTMPGGLLVLAADGSLSYLNDEAKVLLGLSSGDLGRRVAEDLCPSWLLADDACPITLDRLRTAGTHHAEDSFFCGDGTLLPVSYSAAATKSPADDGRVVIVFSDGTTDHREGARLRRESSTLSAIARIRDALAEERFVMYAQPVVDLATDRIVKHELLIRMINHDGSIVPPIEFLPIAEQYGLIKEIDRYVIERAMRFAAQGHAVALNVSAHSLSDSQLGDFVQERLQHHAVDPTLLYFEITETALVENEEAAAQFVRLISSLGCTVALDDFGTGYGSFHYLKHLPVQMLKIDREFVRDLHTDEASRHVVQAVISLAKGLGKITIAEGIEDAETLATLSDLGVDLAQGYFLGRPAPANTVLVGR